MSPGGPSRARRRTAEATCDASGRSSGDGRCSTATSKSRAFGAERGRVEEGGDRRGREHVADMTTIGRVFRAAPSSASERDLPGEVALVVKLVEDDGGHAPELAIGEQRFRVRTPSVTKRTRVFALDTSSNRTR